MKVWFKRGLFSLVVVFIVALVGAAIFLLTFDPNAYKNKLEEIVYERYQRTLTIEGDIELSLFPRIGLAVTSASLSDRLSEDPFASIESARFAVAIWPLMSNRFVVDHVALRGFKAWIVREEDGSFNFTDLLHRSTLSPAPSQTASTLQRFSPLASARAEPTTALEVVDQAASSAGAALKAAVTPDAHNTDFQIDIAGLEFKEGQIHYYDKSNATIARIVDVEVNTGRMTFGQAFDVAFSGDLQGDYPIIDAQFEGQALVKLDPYQNNYSAQRINAQLVGDIADYRANSLQLRGNVAYEPATRLLQARTLELQSQGELKGETPVTGLQFSVTTPQLNYGRDQDTLDFQQLAIRGSGQVEGEPLELAVDVPQISLTPSSAEAEPIVGSVKLGQENVIGLNLQVSDLHGSISDLHAESFTVDGVVKRPNQAWQLKLDSPMHWDRARHQLQWSQLAGVLSLTDEGLPRSPAQADISGEATWLLRQRKWDTAIEAASGQGKLNVSGTYQYRQRPSLAVGVTANDVDLTSWLPSHELRTRQTQAQSDTPPPELIGPVAVPWIDFSPLRAIDISAKAKLENVYLGNLRLEDMTTDMRLDQGDLQLKLQSPRFYQGQINGSLRLLPDNTMRASATGYGIDLGPLLQDSFGQMRASGKSDISLRLETSGYTPAAWLSGLTGSFNLDATDGQIYGLDLEQALRNILHVADNAFSPQLPPLDLDFDLQKSTDFAALSLQSVIDEGQLTFKTLVASTPTLRISTAAPATINLRDQQVDLSLQTRLQK